MPDVLFNKGVCLWLNRYKDALVLLLREVLNRIQFRYNQAQLEELDDETLDDDVRTIYIYFSLCLSCVSLQELKYSFIILLAYF